MVTTFTRRVAPFALLLLFCCGRNLAQDTNTANEDVARKLFSALAGRWSCEGKFANGRPIAADLTFTLRFEGHGLQFEHRDRAPNVFVANAFWGPDSKNHRLVSVGFAGTATAPSPALFIAKTWSATSLTFEAQTLTWPPFAPNRFTYSLADAKLTIAWELQRNGTWSLGDRLECARAN